MVAYTQIKKIITFTLFVLTAQILFAQNPQEDKSGIRIMFYNVENLFYPTNDTLKDDDEFTVEGAKYWSWNRYFDKINKIGKTN